jgi:hypothetical protein
MYPKFFTSENGRFDIKKSDIEEYYYGYNSTNSFAFYKIGDTILFSPYGKTLSDSMEKNILEYMGFGSYQIRYCSIFEKQS